MSAEEFALKYGRSPISDLLESYAPPEIASNRIAYDDSIVRWPFLPTIDVFNLTDPDEPTIIG